MNLAAPVAAALILVVSQSSAQPNDVRAAGKAVLRSRANDSTSARLSETTLNAALTRFPALVSRSDAVALHIQVLLDRAGFSPGIIDGAWGSNAARALSFFVTPYAPESRAGAAAAAMTTLDKPAYERLRIAAGPGAVMERYTVTDDDLRGPFVEVPDDVYGQAKLRCLCYSSAAEAIAERFHISPRLLARLNPGTPLDQLSPGFALLVPNVDNETEASPSDTMIVARLIVSRTGFWTQARDESGRIIFHFPSTLGGGFDPSPLGNFKVVSVSRSPAFRYQPKLFSEVPDSEPEALLPPGPNSPVGSVWIGLSKRHYGIHGTSSPETIGYATSHGCVRLTNWDALQLALLVESGTPVEFR
ncbi:MAG: L,D-transpeptidase family protein [Gemmatimonadaceae bacterium]|nr:L,D-transpeptidase family protein [Gemmatimonadaceae bacterium]